MSVATELTTSVVPISTTAEGIFRRLKYDRYRFDHLAPSPTCQARCLLAFGHLSRELNAGADSGTNEP